MTQECDRALRRIDNEQEKMRLFHEDVKSKFGDMMDDGLLFDDDDDRDGDEFSRTKTFNLNGDLVTYDEPEPDWGSTRNPRYANMRSSAIDAPYNAPEISNTHTVLSLPSDRRLYGDHSLTAAAISDIIGRDTERRRSSDAAQNGTEHRKITDWNDSLSSGR